MTRRSFFALLFAPKKTIEQRVGDLEHRMDKAMLLWTTEFRPPDGVRELPAAILELQRRVDALEWEVMR